MVEGQQRQRRAKKKKGVKAKVPFFPHSPTSVGSPKDGGSSFTPRRVRQRTPRLVCTLVLPPPSPSLFDGNAVDPQHQAASSAADAGIANSAATAPTAQSQSPNCNPSSSASSLVSASVVSTAAGTQGGNSAGSNNSTTAATNNNNNNKKGNDPHLLPSHLRAGLASCHPLLAFDGRYALVGTADGRLGVYSIVGFECEGGTSEDVVASERRRRAEWKEDDNRLLAIQRRLLQMCSGDGRGDGTKDDAATDALPTQQGGDRATHPVGNVSDLSSAIDALDELAEMDELDGLDALDEIDDDEEEHELDMRDRMHRREHGKRNVEPILIVPLPQSSTPGALDDRNQSTLGGGSYDDESTVMTSTTAVNASVANPPAIVGICATPGCGTSLIEQRDAVLGEPSVQPSCSNSSVPTLGRDLLGHVAVLTDDGQVHVLEFLHDDDSTENDGSHEGNDMRNSHVPTVNIVISFRTGCLSATCICMHPSPPGGDEKQAGIRLCVGHRSGMIAEFRMHSTCVHPSKVARDAKELQTPPNTPDNSPGKSPAVPHTRSKSNELSPRKQAAPRVLFRNAGEKSDDKVDCLGEVPISRTLSEPTATSDIKKRLMVVGPARASLCWKGKFDVPIRSVTSAGWATPGYAHGALLVVGTEQTQHRGANFEPMNRAMVPSLPHHSLSPSISLDVVNATLAEHYWCQMRRNHTEEDDCDDAKCISLHDCGVWPAPGREIKDGWMRVHGRGVDPRDKLYGMLGLPRTSITSHVCCFEGPDKSCFASACSDGTVAISHYEPNSGSWGVMGEDNQVMLCQRCIGMGCITSEETRYVACCLRGGTVYIIPVRVQDTGAQEETTGEDDIVTMLALPLRQGDEEDNGGVRFAHSFSAGMARVKHFNSSDSDWSKKPVALIGWAGGNVDIYHALHSQGRLGQ